MVDILGGILNSIKDKASTMLSSSKETVTNSKGKVDQDTLDMAAKYGIGTKDPNHGKPLDEVAPTNTKKKKKSKFREFQDKANAFSETQQGKDIIGALNNISGTSNSGSSVKAAPAAKPNVTAPLSTSPLPNSGNTDFSKYRL